MADVIWLTDPYVKASGQLPQNVDDALDVSAYDEIFLATCCIGITGAVSPNMVVSVYTSMQNQLGPSAFAQNVDGWVLVFQNTLSTGASNSAGNIAYNLLTKGTFLRYLLWQVSSFSGATNMSFWIAGVGRTYSEVSHG